MAIVKFPSVDLAGPGGLLAVGGDLEVESLLLAYREGIFIWPLEEEYLTWFAPPQRAVLFLDEFHISRSLAKERRRSRLTFAFNRNIKQVIRSCAEVINRGSQRGTWITPAVESAYLDLHYAGYCHSIEAYQGDQLVGGLYGVSIGGMFAGESMFYRQPNASKLALCYLVDYLRSKNLSWMDCQVMTPFLRNLGCREVPRNEFMELLKPALEQEVKLFN